MGLREGIAALGLEPSLSVPAVCKRLHPDQAAQLELYTHPFPGLAGLAGAVGIRFLPGQGLQAGERHGIALL